MKKVLFIALLILMTATVQAQEIIDLNRNFNLSGKCVLFTKTRMPQESDKCDMTWELTNKVIGNSNFVTLKMKDADGRYADVVSFGDDVSVFMYIFDDKKKNIIVSDDTFSHLKIYQHEGDQYMVHLYSSLFSDYK